MGKAFKALLAVALTGLFLVSIAGPAFAAPPTVSPTACWNNCGIGGNDQKNY